MVSKTEEYEKIKKAIEEYEKKPLTTKKIRWLRENIEFARKNEEYDISKKTKTPPAEIRVDYQGMHAGAFVKDSKLGKTSNGYWTTIKMVVADDYMKEGRVNEAFALLVNALEKFNEYVGYLEKTVGHVDEHGWGLYYDRSFKITDVPKIFGAIETRALRGAKRALKKEELELAKVFLKLAEDARGKAEHYLKKIEEEKEE